jgi:outer membrane protein TolC
MKKHISIIVTILLAASISTVFAVEGLRFDVEDSKQLAVDNSKQTVIDDLDIKAKETALKEAEKDAKMSTSGNSRTEILDNKIKKQVTVPKAAADIEYAKKVKELNIDKLKLDVYKASLNMVLIRKELEAETAKQEILKEKYNMAEVKFKEGKVTENDLFDAKYALDAKTIDVNKINKKLETANLELKRLVGLSMDDTMVEIKDDLALVSTADIDIDKVVEEALNNDVDVFIKNEEYKASEKTMELTEEEFEEGQPTYADNKLNLESAKYTLEDTKANLEVTIRNKYNDMLTAKDKVELAQKWEAINKTKLDNAQLKYEKGYISKEELLNSKEQYIDAQYQTYLAIYNYNTIKTEFDTLYVK